MTVTSDDASALSVRAQFRQRVRDLTEGRTEVKAADISREAIASLDAETPGFSRDFALAMGESMVHEETLREIGGSRSRALFDISRTARGGLNVGERVMRRYEYVGDGHVMIGKMTRPMLIDAAALRENQATAALKVAAFERQLASGIPDDVATVDQVYQPAQVETIFKKVLDGIDGEIVLRALGYDQLESGAAS